jgi:hypothetical protein
MFQIILNDVDVVFPFLPLLSPPFIYFTQNDLSNSHPIHRFTLGIFIAGACCCILLIRGTHKGNHGPMTIDPPSESPL